DYDHVLVPGGNVLAVGVIAVQQALGVGVQKLHGEVDTLEVAAGSFCEEVIGPSGAAAKHERIELGAELLGRVILADLPVGNEFDPFGGHEIDTALDDPFVKLHVGNAVHEQAANAVGTLEDRNLVPGTIELGSARQSRGAGADDRDLLASPFGGR